MLGALGRARTALRFADFRRLLAARLASQLGDGIFQAFLVNQLVFLSPEDQSTAAGLARALALLIVPFTLLGPFTGVVIDRWSRRGILTATPLARAVVALALLGAAGAAGGVGLYAPALVVVSLNRFYLATAGAVLPALVPREDLLVANSMAGAAGTVVTFAGLVLGTQVAGALGPVGLLLVPAACWVAAAAAGRAIGNPLLPTRAQAPLGSQLRTVLSDLARGARRLAATPPALVAVVSVSFDQFLIGVMTVLSVAVFRLELNEGVASYGRVIGVGGLGVLLGTATVGAFEDRMTKPRIVALSFALAGVACVGASARIAGPTILLISFVLGLTYPWRKVPADTIVQETVPNRYRGRVFALYDAAFALPRVLAALAAIPVIPRLSTGAVVAVTGVLYLLWTPVLPAWVRRPRWVRLRFYAGGRAEEVPRGLVVGGEEEPVEALGSWVVESSSGGRSRRFRLRTADGWRLDVVEAGTGSRWRVAREVPPDGPPGRLVQVGDDAGGTPGL